MIKKFLGVTLLFFLGFQIHAELAIPTVPANIEIAEVKLKITPEAQKEIQKDVNAIRASEKYFNIKLDRALLYFPLIEKILKEEGVPDDIKFLSLQESALISDQVSSANAVGYWQFKDFTAREVGLRVDSKIDERKNIVSSSRGAAKYMKRNNFMLKNWIYAVNAYMTGAGGVKPYIDPSGMGADKITIDKNTHWYVKRFIAHVIAFKEDLGKPHSEGLRLITYEQGKNKELSQIAKQFDIDEDLIHQYNKWLVHGKIPDDRIYSVVIPLTGGSKIPKVKDSEASPTASPTTKYPDKVYPDKIIEGLTKMSKTVFIKLNSQEAIMAGKNDSEKTLAEKAGLSIEKLKKYNDMDHQGIVEGKFYYIHSKKNRSSIRYHVTQYDESLWDIAQRYGVKLKRIRKMNRIEDREQVKPGRILWLRQARPKDFEPEYRQVIRPLAPAPEVIKEPVREEPKPIIRATEEVEKPEAPVVVPKKDSVFTIKQIQEPLELESEKVETDLVDVHEVAAGESLYTIAKKYDITVEDILKWNGLNRNESINPGQKLQVATPMEVGVMEFEEKPISPAMGNEKTYTVRPDDTYYSISKKYNVSIEDLLRRNRLSIHDPIKPGQGLIIPPVFSEQIAPKPSGNTYKVQAGDTFYKIARQFNITVEELMKLNNKKEPHLSLGEEIRVK